MGEKDTTYWCTIDNSERDVLLGPETETKSNPQSVSISHSITCSSSAETTDKKLLESKIKIMRMTCWILLMTISRREYF